MLSKEQLQHLESALSNHLSRSLNIQFSSPVGGGSINNCYRLETTAGKFFVKQNQVDKFPGMFEAEKKGMELLRNNINPELPGDYFEKGNAERKRMKLHRKLRVPEIYFTTVFLEHQYLAMEFLEPGVRGKDFFFEFGKSIADLHILGNESFGLDHDNYIGRLPQSNSSSDDWITFFVEQRLEKQVHEAVDNKALEISTARLFQKLYVKLNSLIPKELPSLLHGDLWSGNFMCDINGTACIFDPAVYFGHREMDIAMTKLFGGFSQEFYDSYNEHFPMEKDWERRMDICNLYPLMVHVNLFGGNYLQEVKAILQQYV